MATSARRLVAPDPPPELDSIALPLTAPGSPWFRLVHRRHGSPLHWSRAGRYRFDSPEAKWGVCYAAESITAAFQEIWGDELRRARRLDWLELEPMVVWQIAVPPALRVVELAGETLSVIRATLQSFVGAYPRSQRWGRALMAHPAEVDALRYLGRRCGRPCLALFGDAASPKPYQAKLKPERLGLLVHWAGLWAMLDRLQVRVAHLPPTPPSVRWR